MAITASMVKELRDRTGIAMMKCKKALAETDGDLEAAVVLLRKQGLAAADKKADRATSCGGIGLATEGGKGAVVLLACETDFVSGNDVFKTFANDVAAFALSSGVDSVDAFVEADWNGQKVSDALAQFILKIGENIKIEDVKHLSGDIVTGYSHGGRVVTVVAGSGDAGALRNVAMHVAAANPAPLALDRDGVDPELVQKEKDIIAASDDVQSKPEAIQPKIVEGKMGRFYKENVLKEQEMLVDNENGDSVEKYIAGKGGTVTGFLRLSV